MMDCVIEKLNILYDSPVASTIASIADQFYLMDYLNFFLSHLEDEANLAQFLKMIVRYQESQLMFMEERHYHSLFKYLLDKKETSQISILLLHDFERKPENLIRFISRNKMESKMLSFFKETSSIGYIKLIRVYLLKEKEQFNSEDLKSFYKRIFQLLESEVFFYRLQEYVDIIESSNIENGPQNLIAALI